jgi:hypothetical protein
MAKNWRVTSKRDPRDTQQEIQNVRTMPYYARNALKGCIMFRCVDKMQNGLCNI